MRRRAGGVRVPHGRRASSAATPSARAHARAWRGVGAGGVVALGRPALVGGGGARPSADLGREIPPGSIGHCYTTSGPSLPARRFARREAQAGRTQRHAHPEPNTRVARIAGKPTAAAWHANPMLELSARCFFLSFFCLEGVSFLERERGAKACRAAGTTTAGGAFCAETLLDGPKGLGRTTKHIAGRPKERAGEMNE